MPFQLVKFVIFAASNVVFALSFGLNTFATDSDVPNVESTSPSVNALDMQKYLKTSDEKILTLLGMPAALKQSDYGPMLYVYGDNPELEELVQEVADSAVAQGYSVRDIVVVPVGEESGVRIFSKGEKIAGDLIVGDVPSVAVYVREQVLRDIISAHLFFERGALPKK